MQAAARNSIKTLPLYRLIKAGQNYEILRWEEGSETTFYDWHTNGAELIAGTTSLPAALAVLRLFDVTYEDWT